MIVDVHQHLGYDCVFDEEQWEEELIECNEKHGIDLAIVQPLIGRPYLEDTREIHDRIHKLCQDHPGRYLGMISMNPHFRPEDYEAEASRCIRGLGFVGIKLTTIAHAVHPSNQDAFTVYEIARSLDVPVMIHTGAGIPFSDPVSIWKAAENFKDVRFVLAHAGANLGIQQAMLLASKFENVYLEPSWIPINAFMGMYKTLGPAKILFSSDLAINVPMELTKYREVIKDPQDLAQAMSKTAIDVYKLKI